MTAPGNDVPFRLAVMAHADGPPFVALVQQGSAIELRAAEHAYHKRRGRPASALALDDGILGLLGDWGASFAALQQISAFLDDEGLGNGRLAEHVHDPASLRTLPPISRPSKIMCVAQNYREHVEEMRASHAATPGAESAAAVADPIPFRPYLWLKAPSAITGPFDDIELPSPDSKIDWEVELALVIGKSGRRISVDDAMSYVAGFVTMNDVSRRDALLRPDRMKLRTDWYAGKSYDGFAPIGPYFVPRQFVDHRNLRLRLSVNGELKQDGNTSGLIISAEENLAYASTVNTLVPGDIIATGTCGGVGHGTGTYLKPGDVVEAEVEHLGSLRNRFVAGWPT